MLLKLEKKDKGFTLIELMIVVVIIGILAALAIPNFLKYQARAKQSEAKTNLGAIYTSEIAYFGENNLFGARTSTDWEPKGQTKYAYDLTAGATTFTAQATANIDADATIDTWTIDQDKHLTNSINDVAD
jgi:prepilin-type N-terminal cleavage/methylation domain-containing protein